MDTEKVIERWKATAEIFVRDNTRAFIKDISGDIYFCEIVLVGDDTLTIQCFGPTQRSGKTFVLYWTLLEEFEPYNEEEEVKG
jgi:hypothetical protein